MLGRALYWGRALRNSHDWDAGYLDTMVVLKLRRLEAAFNSPHSYHSPECENYKPKMRSITLAVKLGDRLVADKYADKAYGLLNYEFKKLENGHSQLLSIDPATNLEASDELRRHVSNLHRRAENRQTKDRQIMYNIIAKYGPYWWD